MFYIRLPCLFPFFILTTIFVYCSLCRFLPLSYEQGTQVGLASQHWARQRIHVVAFFGLNIHMPMSIANPDYFSSHKSHQRSIEIFHGANGC